MAHGGLRHNAGRKPDKIKKLEQEIAGRVLSELDEESSWGELVRDKDPNIRLKALIYLSDRQYGKAKETLKHEGEVNLKQSLIVDL
jgi:hypothetical protein